MKSNTDMIVIAQVIPASCFFSYKNLQSILDVSNLDNTIHFYTSFNSKKIFVKIFKLFPVILYLNIDK